MVVYFYAAVLALIFVLLSLKVISVRRKKNIILGNMEDQDLLRANSAHSNFASYIPFALFLFLLLELKGAGPLFLHFIGITLVLSRILHPISLMYLEPKYNFLKVRVLSMALTFIVFIIAALLLMLLA